jgi:hypothetical protein
MQVKYLLTVEALKVETPARSAFKRSVNRGELADVSPMCPAGGIEGLGAN